MVRRFAPSVSIRIAWAVLVWLPGPSPAQAADRPDPVADPAPPYWSDAWRGWHFYEAPAPDTGIAARPPQPTPQATSPGGRTPTGKPPELSQFEQMQKDLETSRHIAIMRPTEANVRHYMALEAQVVSRASHFADVAQRIAWRTPELDPALQGRPVNAKALEVFERQEIRDRSHVISALGQDHVLLFFFRGDCPYCHAVAPTLAAFQARHGIRVVAVSVDGGSMPGFADARPDNGTARSLQVTQVPAVFLAQPFTGTITPIGFGVLSEAELLERIATVSSPAAASVPPGIRPRAVLQ